MANDHPDFTPECPVSIAVKFQNRESIPLHD